TRTVRTTLLTVSTAVLCLLLITAERGLAAPRTRTRPPARDRDSSSHRLQPVPTDSSIPDREPDRNRSGWCRWRRARGSGQARLHRVEPARHTPRESYTTGYPCAGGGHHGRHGDSPGFGPRSCAPRVARGSN